jgi:hypothetical protein
MNAPQPAALPVGYGLSPGPWEAGGVGGTSGGGEGSSANTLSVNMGGASFNYDMGPDTEHFANSAYDFLGSSFSADSALLGSTIVGSQNFLTGFAAPIENFNTQVLPSMFGTLSAQNYSLGEQAVSAESDVARASIASSAATAQEASSGGGGCFITTATCEVVGEADNGRTLTTLRNFRDRYCVPHNAKLVKLYYAIAPEILTRIRARADAREFLERIFTVFIMPARDAIERGEDERAFRIYTSMLVNVAQEA